MQVLKQEPIGIKQPDIEWKSTFDAITDMVSLQDRDYKLIRVNKAYADALKMAPEALVGKTCYEVLHGTKKPWPNCPHQKALKTHKPAKLEFFEPNLGVYLEVSASPIFNEKGEATGSVHIAKNITERKRAEQALNGRMKELKCIYNVANIASTPDITPDALYQEVANLLPRCWQYPEIACARITIGDRKFRTENYRETEWKQSSDITIDGERAGLVEVGYLEARPEIDEGPFSKEERLLIDAVAERLGRATERKRAEEALRESEQRFKDVAENAIEWIWEVNADGEYIYASPVCEKILGYKPKELLGKYFYDLFPPEERDQLKEAALNKFAQKRPFHEFINRNMHKNGEIVWLSTSGTPILDERGNLLGYRGADTDITERQRMQDALKESEAHYRELAESISDVFFALDKNLRYTYWNKASEELFGIPAKDALGKNIYDVSLDPEQTKRVEDVYLKALRTQQPQYFVNEYHHDGKNFFFEINAYPTESGLTVFIKDVSGRKRIEQRWWDSMENFYKVVDNSADGIIITSREGIVRFANPAAELLFGRKRDDLQDEPFSFPAAPGDTTEIDITRPNGETVTAEMRVVETVWFDESTYLATLRDITERKLMEEALTQSEERYRNLFDNTSDLIQSITTDGRFIYVNNAWQKVLGYSKDEIANLSVWDIIHPDSLPHCEEVFQRVMSGKPVKDIETVFVAKDGRLVVVEGNAQCYFNNGKPVSTQGIFRDITERKRAEEQLQFLGSVTQQVSDSVYVTDKDHKIIYINEAAEKLFGYKMEELRGLTPGTLDARAPEDSMREDIGQTISSGNIWTGESLSRRKDGSTFPSELQISPLHDEQGRISSHITIMRDITERRRAEEQLRFLSSVTQQVSDSVIVTDRDHKIIYINEAAEKLYGYKMEELRGLTPTILDTRSAADRMRKGIGQTVASGKVWTGEVLSRRKDGSTFPSDLKVSPLYDEQGRISSHITIMRDITEKKRAEQAQKRLSRQLQEKVSELETFSYGVAHDLRSPLVSIQGFVHLLQADIQNMKAARVQEDIQLIEAGVRKMQELLHRTLEYSRAGYQVKPARNVSFAGIAREVVAEFAEQVRSVGGTISVSKKFPKVYADSVRIRQVLTNLIQNSLKYRDETTPLSIEVGYQPAGNEVIFFVRDNGAGIDESEVEKVFTLFYRGTSASEGSGAGLAIVKKIIEAHGGRVWAEGEPGKGTTIYFTLPQQGGKAEGGADGKD